MNHPIVNNLFGLFIIERKGHFEIASRVYFKVLCFESNKACLYEIAFEVVNDGADKDKYTDDDKDDGADDSYECSRLSPQNRTYGEPIDAAVESSPYEHLKNIYIQSFFHFVRMIKIYTLNLLYEFRGRITRYRHWILFFYKSW